MRAAGVVRAVSGELRSRRRAEGHAPGAASTGLNRSRVGGDQSGTNLTAAAMESLGVFALGVVAFGLASLAAQSWRELGMLLVLSALIYWPVKWLAAGTFLGGDVLTYPAGGGFRVAPTGACIVAVLFAASVMILARHVMLGKRESGKAADL